MTAFVAPVLSNLTELTIASPKDDAGLPNSIFGDLLAMLTQQETTVAPSSDSETTPFTGGEAVPVLFARPWVLTHDIGTARGDRADTPVPKLEAPPPESAIEMPVTPVREALDGGESPAPKNSLEAHTDGHAHLRKSWRHVQDIWDNAAERDIAVLPNPVAALARANAGPIEPETRDGIIPARQDFQSADPRSRDLQAGADGGVVVVKTPATSVPQQALQVSEASDDTGNAVDMEARDEVPASAPLFTPADAPRAASLSEQTFEPTDPQDRGRAEQSNQPAPSDSIPDRPQPELPLVRSVAVSPDRSAAAIVEAAKSSHGATPPTAEQRTAEASPGTRNVPDSESPAPDSIALPPQSADRTIASRELVSQKREIPRVGRIATAASSVGEPAASAETENDRSARTSPSRPNATEVNARARVPQPPNATAKIAPAPAESGRTPSSQPSAAADLAPSVFPVQTNSTSSPAALPPGTFGVVPVSSETISFAPPPVDSTRNRDETRSARAVGAAAPPANSALQPPAKHEVRSERDSAPPTASPKSSIADSSTAIAANGKPGSVPQFSSHLREHATATPQDFQAAQPPSPISQPSVPSPPVAVAVSPSATASNLLGNSAGVAPDEGDPPIVLSFRTVAGLPDAAESMDALALRIAAKSAGNSSKFQIRLDPPQLGRIEVSLKLDAQGNAQATLSADKPHTLDLLQRDAPTLERALKDAGLMLPGGLSFSLKGDGRPGTGRDPQGSTRSRNLQIASIDATGTEAALPASVAHHYGVANARLDIRV